MAITRKVLGQMTTPASSAYGTLYTVPAATTTVVSTLILCNAGAATQISVRIRVGGAAADPKQLICSNLAMAANQTIALTAGITLAATDVVEASSPSTNVTVQLFGEESA